MGQRVDTVVIFECDQCETVYQQDGTAPGGQPSGWMTVTQTSWPQLLLCSYACAEAALAARRTKDEARRAVNA